MKMDAERVVAIQGEAGCNSHMVAVQYFQGQPIRIVACRSSAEVFDRLHNGMAGAAVLPIENSLHGSVFEHYDLLLEHEFPIVGETMMRVRHNVIAAPGVTLDKVKKVMSHPVALSQCRKWLRAHDSIEAVPAYDTAGSVKQLMAEGWRDVAGIAPTLAAQEYGAQVIESGIEDHTENYTRFYVLASAVSKPHIRPVDKASVGFSVEHRPGSLVEALAVFERAGLNLTKIESRPVPGKPWEYVFFADVQFDDVRRWEQAAGELALKCRMVRELGRYASASLEGIAPQ